MPAAQAARARLRGAGRDTEMLKRASKRLKWALWLAPATKPARDPRERLGSLTSSHYRRGCARAAPRGEARERIKFEQQPRPPALSCPGWLGARPRARGLRGGGTSSAPARGQARAGFFVGSLEVKGAVVQTFAVVLVVHVAPHLHTRRISPLTRRHSASFWARRARTMGTTTEGLRSRCSRTSGPWSACSRSTARRCTGESAPFQGPPAQGPPTACSGQCQAIGAQCRAVPGSAGQRQAAPGSAGQGSGCGHGRHRATPGLRPDTV